MIYIDVARLMQFSVRQEQPDAIALLKSINHEKVFRDLWEKKVAFPSAFSATGDPVPEENFSKLPAKVRKELTAIHHKIKMDAKSLIKKIEEFNVLYPNVPYIYNLLANAYTLAGNDKKALETIKEVHLRFPKYLFGKTQLAEFYIKQEKPEMAANVLGNKFDINEHFPSGKKLYHISEIMSFYCTVGAYFAAIDAPDRALACYFILEGFNDKHPLTKQLALVILAQQIKEIRGK